MSIKHETERLYANTGISSATLAGKGGFGGVYDSNGKVAVASSMAGEWPDFIIGWDDLPTAADEPVNTLHGGIVLVVAGGTVSAGDSVTLDAAGEWVTATPGERAFGYALDRYATYEDGVEMWIKVDRHIASGSNPTATAAAEASDSIAVSFDSGFAGVSQWLAEIFDSEMKAAAKSAFMFDSIADGAGSPTTAAASVSDEDAAALLFTTDSNGLAILAVDDVATGSGLSVFVRFSPLPSSGDAPTGHPIEIALTFD